MTDPDSKYCFPQSVDPDYDTLDVWEKQIAMGDPGALELVESTPKLGFKDPGCKASS
tara:strand:+ start:41 stop:211 length:171 start_codon:yes stop_codon:yes gene_type:complete